MSDNLIRYENKIQHQHIKDKINNVSLRGTENIRVLLKLNAVAKIVTVVSKINVQLHVNKNKIIIKINFKYEICQCVQLLSIFSVTNSVMLLYAFCTRKSLRFLLHHGHHPQRFSNYCTA